MNVRDWTYRKKNKAVVFLVIVTLFISWFLAFGKTYRLIRDYHKIEDNLENNPWIHSNKKSVSDKVILQDSLLSLYTADSVVWSIGLLSNLSDVIIEQKVRVNFENHEIKTNHKILEREVTLIGTYRELEKSLKNIEGKFFIKSVKLYVDKGLLKCQVTLVVIKE
ncbi:hypothetical protein [Sphingobacterium cellulitidis]|uniref:Uncharacterized protein n=1 Tax=Sphingobacterium cellulitidis TaxID=1768011 RepID=A0A8H9KXA8_9SPHI|nr:hypothetical protein [Sphingobacterium soli]MBA8986154.1 hypothetical protein [Sphingobacterium soli]GGE18040.1 hypothetical protein GCM10011516_14600 [Sphingobacterium soli]